MTGREVLSGAGHVSADQAKKHALKQYEIYDEHRLQMQEEQEVDELMQSAKDIKMGKKEVHVLKFNFKVQKYQTDAVDSVVGVFKGQPYSDLVNYRRDIGKVKSSVSYSQMSFVDSLFEQQQLNLTDDFFVADWRVKRSVFGIGLGNR